MRLFIRGTDAKGYLINSKEYAKIFAKDAIKKNGMILGYIHKFYNEFIVVDHNLNTLFFRPTMYEARNEFSLRLKLN